MPPLIVLEGCHFVGSETGAGTGDVNPALPRALKGAPRALDRFYRSAGYHTLWVNEDGPLPTAEALIDALQGAASDGLDPALFQASVLRKRLEAVGDDRRDLARLEVALSQAFVQYASALNGDPAPAPMIYVDQQLAPPRPSPEALLSKVAAAGDFTTFLGTLRVRNPIYAGLRDALGDYRERWGKLPSIIVPPGPVLEQGDTGSRVEALGMRLGRTGVKRFTAEMQATLRAFQQDHGLTVSGAADAPTIAALNRGPEYYEALIRANMHRARSLPLDLSRRYILVNAADAELRMVDEGNIVGGMPVVVGRSALPTPEMAGLIRFVVLNPYWNLPPDLAAERAARIARNGPALLDRERLEVLAGWGPDAPQVEPSAVKWSAWQEDGDMRMRQLPGQGNMMGRMKFMLPNRYGIYLHDTPNKAAFKRDDRRLSAGCVRVSDAQRLARWLFAGDMPAARKAPETRVDLPQPVPVYISYFTVEAKNGRAVFLTDSYGRDPAILAMMAKQDPAPARL